MFHIHRSVLFSVPYFSTLLDGCWPDAENPEVELPCSPDEFGLLLGRLYAGERLGSLALPVTSCGAALRISAAAAMLLIDDKLPELPNVLRASVRTPEDVQLAVQARAVLPGALGKVLEELFVPNSGSA